MAIPTSNYAPRQWPIIQGLSYSYTSEHFGVLRQLGTTLAIERAASNGSFDPPEGYEDDKRM